MVMGPMGTTPKRGTDEPRLGLRLCLCLICSKLHLCCVLCECRHQPTKLPSAKWHVMVTVWQLYCAHPARPPPPKRLAAVVTDSPVSRIT